MQTKQEPNKLEICAPTNFSAFQEDITMSQVFDLKQIERKAFRATHQDGLWDIFFGLVVIFMAINLYRPESGYSAWNIIIFLVGYVVANLIFWGGKIFITMPRMGQVKFGPIRKKRGTHLAIALGVIVIINVGLVLLTMQGWANPERFSQLNAFLLDRGWMDIAVALIGSLLVGTSMTLMAYFNDFPRGYYIASLASLAVFLMIWLNQPIFPIILGGLILIPGIVLFIRFLSKYPLPKQEAFHG
jgi:hypothetical protein